MVGGRGALKWRSPTSPYLLPMDSFSKGFPSLSPAGHPWAGVDGIEEAYLTGWANFMSGAPYSLNGSAEAIAVAEELDLGSVLEELRQAYIASALSGKMVRFTFGEGGEPHEFTWKSASRRFIDDPDPLDIEWKAVEDLPRWRGHYHRYREVLESLPELLKRLEILAIEDSELGRRSAQLSEGELREQIRTDTTALNEVLRNDGFLIHSSSKKISAIHRDASQVIRGLEALKDDALAASGYPEAYLWGSQSEGGGLAGVDRRDRERIEMGVAFRTSRTWGRVVDRVLAEWLYSQGVTEKVTISWGSPFKASPEDASKTDLCSAQAAEIWIALGVFTVEEIRAKYLGGTAPSQEVSPDDESPDTIAAIDIDAEAITEDGPRLTRGSTFTPTKAVQDAASRGLALRREHGRGGTAVGIARARDLSAGKDIPLKTIRRMYSFFARHRVDKQGANWDRPSNGKIAWLLWGGDPGSSWVSLIRDRAIRAGVW